jgi:hypothetical protein
MYNRSCAVESVLWNLRYDSQDEEPIAVVSRLWKQPYSIKAVE